MVGSESTYWLFWQEKTTEMVNTVIQLVAPACVDRVGGGPSLVLRPRSALVTRQSWLDFVI